MISALCWYAAYATALAVLTSLTCGHFLRLRLRPPHDHQEHDQ